MPYRGNPSTDINDAVRLLIGDTSSSTASEIFSDAEIDYFVSLKPNAYLSAAAALGSVLGSTRAASIGANELASKKIGDLTLQYRSGAAQGSYLTLREKIRTLRLEGVRKVKPYAGGISRSDKQTARSDADRDPPHFSIGMTDHPGLGTNSSSTWR